MAVSSLCALAVLATAVPAAQAQDRSVERTRRSDQQRAFEARRDGRIMPLPVILSHVLPQMQGAQYLGYPSLDGPVYTLKFLKDGNVIWVEVDARTGAIIDRTDR